MRKFMVVAAAAVASLAMVVSGCGSSSSKSTSGSSTAAANLGLKTPGTLLVGSDYPYKPFEFTQGGKVTGFDYDLVTAVAATFGVTDVKFQQERFDTIFTSTAQGRFDMAASSITITPERAKTVAFSSPYFEANQSIMVRANDAKGLDALNGATITPQVADSKLKGMSLGVQRGTTGADLAKTVPGGNVNSFQLVDDAFNALAAKRVDAVVNDYAISQYATKAHSELKVVAKVSPSENYGFAFPKKNTALLAAFNAGLTKIKANGTYAQIYKKWFNEAPPTN
ncbi:MAG: basic amino acid ABC transporter substrate-binding protein [Thermoleophilia bacterium]